MMRDGRLKADASREEVCGFFDVSRESCRRLQIYADELGRWQKRINLVGPATLKHLWVRHIADGLQLARLLPQQSRQVIDLGSGSGVPGLVLALGMERDIHIVLVESNAKKAAFLRNVAQKAGVRVRIENRRIEELDVAALGCDVHTTVTARALAPLPKLLDLAFPMLEKGAQGLFFKGQDVGKELTEATKYWNIRHDVLPSVTDESGAILRIREIERV